jgi:hypothetical protein
MKKPALTAVVFLGIVATVASSYARRPIYMANPYAPRPGFVPYPDYGAPPPVACPGGYWAHRPLGYDTAGNVTAWGPPRYFCA